MSSSKSSALYEHMMKVNQPGIDKLKQTFNLSDESIKVMYTNTMEKSLKLIKESPQYSESEFKIIEEYAGPCMKIILGDCDQAIHSKVKQMSPEHQDLISTAMKFACEILMTECDSVIVEKMKDLEKANVL